MQVIEKPKQMQSLSEALRREGKKIAFVPTMGYFHEGHLTLMREAKRLGDVLVVSIFVNPLQFGPSEDYDRYPRDLERDLKMAEEVGVDIVFHPQVEDIYPPNFQTYVEVSELQKYLCGRFRPNHFRGVATVVLKLFNIVKPHVAVFGLKDYQQYLIIKRMVEDLNLDVEVVGIPTVREEDNLAASSRNVYLNAEERKAARALYKALMEAKRLFEEGERNASKLLEASRKVIEREPLVNLQYLELCDPETLEPLSGNIERALLAIAAWVGKTRLIDNIILE
jgi:pantoate--beta-alanine ligase